MSTKVVDLTAEELASLIDDLLDRKLAQWLGDPDEGVDLRPEIVERIERQRAAYAAGERGRTLEDLTQRFGVR